MSFDPALITVVSRQYNYRNIKNVNYIGAAGGPMFTREVVPIVAKNGEPAAIPVGDGIRDLDYRYNYINGEVGGSMRLLQYNPKFNIDWISGETRATLKRMKHNRELVHLSPNFGRNTMLSCFPTLLAGNKFLGTTIPAVDNSETTGIEAQQDPDTLMWDHWQKMFRGGMALNNNCVIPTPAGAGMFTLPYLHNRWQPSYPESATEGSGAGTSGWRRGGAHSADITLTHKNSGFLHIDCPHSLRVQCTNLIPTGDRYIAMTGAWNPAHGDYLGYTVTGAGYVMFGVWIKGRLPRGAHLTAYQVNYSGTTKDEFFFDDEDFSDWRPVVLSVYSNNWNASDFPLIVLAFDEANADPADFEIGPMIMNRSNSGYVCSEPVWRDWSAGASTPFSRIKASYFTPPAAGSMTASVYIPKGFTSEKKRIGLMNSGDTYLDMYLDTPSTPGLWTVRAGNSAYTYYNYWTAQPDDEVVVVTFQWGAGKRQLYVNGERIGQWTGTAQDYASSGVAGDAYLGHSGHGSYPAMFLTGRIDNEMFTDEQIKYLHSSLRDPGALAVSVAARGRLFEITSIPETPRPSPAGTQWVGKLAFRQAQYDHLQADITTKETTEF